MTKQTELPARDSFSDLVDRIFNAVQDHMNWDREKTLLWLRTKNPYLGRVTPDDFILRQPKRAEKFIMSMIEREPS